MIYQDELEAEKQLIKINDTLNIMSHRLKRRAFFVVLSTAINIGCLLVILGLILSNPLDFGYYGIYKLFAFIIAILLLIQSLIYIYRFEQIKKSGDIVFDEASDYYEWATKNEFNKNESYEFNSNIFQLRVAFREYTRSCDLPFIPGKQGLGAYTSINVLSLFVIVLMLGIIPR